MSERAGDVSSICMGLINKQRCAAMITRIHNSKYNGSVSFNYIRERLFHMKIAEWELHNEL
jgi:hypothetical protein